MKPREVSSTATIQQTVGRDRLEDMRRLVQERDRDIQKIEQDVKEINGMMKDVAALVADQGDMINSIEDHLDQAVASSKDAVLEIKVARKIQKKTTCSVL